MEHFVTKYQNLIQNGEVEIHAKSNPNFYTLKGCGFGNGKLMTDNHMEVNNITIQKLFIIQFTKY